MKKIKNFKAFFESKTNESFSLKSGGVYYYHTSSSSGYAMPQVEAYEDDIPFDEKASEWSMPQYSVQDLFNSYFDENGGKYFDTNRFLEEVSDALKYKNQPLAIENMEELLNDHDLGDRYSAEMIVKDLDYRIKFFTEIRGAMINDLKDVIFKRFKENLYPYDKVWNFIVVGDIKPVPSFELNISNDLYSALKYLSGIKDGKFIILAYCVEEENFHMLDQNNTFTDTGISVETTEGSEEDEIVRIISGLEISEDPIFMCAIPEAMAKRIYEIKGKDYSELESTRIVINMGLI